MRLALVLLLACLLASCQKPVGNPHYVLGAPYQAGGYWYYPRDTYDYHETGLAAVYASGHTPLTANGELFDQTALAAAHQTLQLPALAQITDLDNGRQLTVRINDRGPASPHRLIEVTPRVASLLGFPSDGVARVRVDVVAEASQAALEGMTGVPKLEISVAPVGAVQQTNLGAPGSVAAASAPAASAAVPSAAGGPVNIARLPETVTQVAANPGRLFVQLGTFHGFQYANIQRARVASLGAEVVSTAEGRTQSFHVMIGPIENVQQADMVLDQVLRSGVTDARIVVE